MVLPVGALFRGEAPLVHGVGGVQKTEGVLHKGGVGGDEVHSLQEHGHIPRQGRGGAHILGDGANAESAAPGFQAGKDVDTSGENGTGSRGRGGKHAPGAFIKAVKRSPGYKGRLLHSWPDDLLLAVGTDVQPPLAVRAHIEQLVKETIAQGSQIVHLGLLLHENAGSDCTEPDRQGHHCHQGQRRQEAVENAPFGVRHRADKERHGEAQAAEDAHYRLNQVF